MKVSPAKARGLLTRPEPSSTVGLLPRPGETSPILEALGAASFAAFQAIRYPGTVVWCNFDLLRELGFDVHRSNQLTPELNKQLLAAFSLRSLAARDDACGNDVLTLYADKYGGGGVAPALGAGRAGFLPQGNFYVKGLGFTPLFRHNDPNDFVHSHGGVHLEDCLSEAVFGEVNHNLFTLGSNRIVAIIDQQKYVTDPSGRQRHIALAIRAGAQLRPGHLLAKRARGSRSPVEMFIHIARTTNQLVTTSEGPDVSATMLRIIDDHALTAAESFRWRMIHGALSPSNMDFSGAMLDLPTQSTQPRTAPIFKLDYVNSVYGIEHKERGFFLADMYRRVLRTTNTVTRERLNAKWINISNEMDIAYAKYLQVKLLSAAGLKTSLAKRLQTEHADLSSEFTNVVLELAALKNPGSACVARKVVEDVSVVDVFNLLGGAPRDYFRGRLRRDTVLKHLSPVFKGNRFHVAKKKETVESLAGKFLRVYRELINVSMDHAADYYDNLEAMQASITARAAFENGPIDALYTYSLYEALNKAIREYKATGDTERLSEVIDSTIARSLRSVDGLLAQGESRRLPDGGVELEMRAIRGISYAVRAWDDRSQTRKLHVNIPIEIGAERYRFTTDGWKTSQEVQGRVRKDRIEFELSVSNLVGRLEGYSSVKRRRLGGYVFALPDRYELKSLLARRGKE